MRALVPALALALTACWQGPAAFAPRDDAGVVRPGTYHLHEIGRTTVAEEDDRLVLARGPTGGLRDGGGDWTFTVVPLDATMPATYIVQGVTGSGALYALLDTSGGRLRIALPECDEAARARVVESGGSVAHDPNSPTGCLWRDGGAMLAALRDWARTNPAPTMELIPERQP